MLYERCSVSGAERGRGWAGGGAARGEYYGFGLTSVRAPGFGDASDTLKQHAWTHEHGDCNVPPQNHKSFFFFHNMCGSAKFSQRSTVSDALGRRKYSDKRRGWQRRRSGGRGGVRSTM